MLSEHAQPASISGVIVSPPQLEEVYDKRWGLLMQYVAAETCRVPMHSKNHTASYSEGSCFMSQFVRRSWNCMTCSLEENLKRDGNSSSGKHSTKRTS